MYLIKYLVSFLQEFDTDSLLDTTHVNLKTP